MPQSPCATCDGGGITFTQNMEQADVGDADSIAMCPQCGPARFGGYDAVYLARRLAERLLVDLVDHPDIREGRKVWTHIVACYGDDRDAPDSVFLRYDLAEASICGHENAKVGFYTESVSVQVRERWQAPHEAMLDLGDAVRVLLDARVGDGGSRRELVGPLRDCAQTILDASEFIRSRVPVLQGREAADQEDRDLRAAGMFQALVEVGVLYCETIGGDDMDACATMLQGLVENVEPLLKASAEQGGTKT